VFIREMVPRRAIAFLARAFYNENYVALPMTHEIRRAVRFLVALGEALGGDARAQRI